MILWSMVDDPFLDIKRCISRLFNEWETHKRLIVAVDFDDTVFPFKVDATHSQLWGLLKRCQENNFYIVVWTASSADRFDFIRNYFKENGIEISSINENPIPLPYGNGKKIYYNHLLDDRAGLESSVMILKSVLDLIDLEKS